MRIEERINKNYEKLNENERYLCRQIKNHPRDCYGKSIEEFARECHVSKTMLVRFAKKLGLSGYKELKARLRMEAGSGGESPKELMEKVTQSYHKMMDQLRDRDLSSFFALLQKARRVYVYGSGSSQARAASEMKRIFLPAREMVNIHGHDMCRALKKNAGQEDLVILISLSGESQPAVELGESLREKGVPTVSITRRTSNRLASLCRENLYINSIQMPLKYDQEYEITTPYFILIEYLYLSYENYLSGKAGPEGD